MKHKLKKSTSLLLAILMIMSCWVFTPMDVEATNSCGGFKVSMVVKTYSGMDTYIKNLRLNAQDYTGATERVYAKSSMKNYSVTEANANVVDIGSLNAFLSSAEDTTTLTYTFKNFPCFIALAFQKWGDDSSASFSVESISINNVNVGVNRFFKDCSSTKKGTYISAPFYLDSSEFTAAQAGTNTLYSKQPVLTMNNLGDKTVTATKAGTSINMGDLTITDQYNIRHKDITTATIGSEAYGATVSAAYGDYTDKTPIIVTVPESAQTPGAASERTIPITINTKSLNSNATVSKTVYLKIVDTDYTVKYDANAPTGTSVSLSTPQETKNWDTPNNADNLAGAIAGYSFDGWFPTQDKDFTSADTSYLGDQLTKDEGIRSDTTYYAAWSIENYMIDFVDQNNNTVGTYNLDYGMDITEYANKVEVDADTYDSAQHTVFDGWYDQDGVKLDSATKATKDATYTAKYRTEDHAYTHSDDRTTWETVSEASCTNPKVIKNTCKYCDHYVTENDGTALGHARGAEITEKYKEADLNTYGHRYYDCTRCDEEIVTDIPALRAVRFDFGDGRVVNFNATEGENISKFISQVKAQEDPTKAPVTGIEYIFKGWQTADQVGTQEYKTTGAMGGYEVQVTDEVQVITPYFEAQAAEYDLSYTYTTIDGEQSGTAISTFGTSVYETLKEFAQPYQTESRVYNFEGWYYKDESNNEVRVGEGAVFMDDMDIYAKYTDTARTFVVTVNGVGTQTINDVAYGTKVKDIGILVGHYGLTIEEKTHTDFAYWVVSGETTDASEVEVTSDLTIDAYYITEEHDFVKNETESWDADCTKFSHLVEYCSVCDRLRVTEGTAMGDHKWGEAYVIPAGENTYGHKQHKCLTCNSIENLETYPALRQVVFQDTTSHNPVQIHWIEEGSKLTEAQVPEYTDWETPAEVYEFNGWKFSDTEDIADFATFVVPANGPTVFYTNWDKSPKMYTVSFVDKVNIANTFYSIEVPFGTAIEKIETPALPEVYIDEVNHTTWTPNAWKADVLSVVNDIEMYVDYAQAPTFYEISFSDGQKSINAPYDAKFGLPTSTKGEAGQYIFNGWKTEDGELITTPLYTVKGNAHLTADFSLATYDVTFEMQGQADKVVTAKYGDKIFDIAPERDSYDDVANNIRYIYTGWTNGSEKVTFDSIVKGTYTITADYKTEQINKAITVTYEDKDGKELAVVDAFENDLFNATAATADQYYHDDDNHYAFAGWKTTDGTKTYDATTVLPATNVIVKADYTAKPHNFEERVKTPANGETDGLMEYYCTDPNCGFTKDGDAIHAVEFIVDGVVVETKQVRHGDEVAFDELPTVTKPNSGNVEFAFKHYEVDGAEITRDYEVNDYTKFVAVFDTTTLYTVTFTDALGTVTTEKVKHGEMPKGPAKVASYSDDMYNYTFSGWTPEVVAATEAADYTATYTKAPKTIKVQFAISNKLIDSTTEYDVVAGEAFTGTVPPVAQYTADNDEHIEFIGWAIGGKMVEDLGAVLASVKSEHDFLYIEAQFKSSPHVYGEAGNVTQTATCQRPELSECICTVCGQHAVVQTAPKTDHVFEFNRTEEQNGVTYNIYKCKYCSEEYKEAAETGGDDQTVVTGKFGPFLYTDHTPAAGIKVRLYQDGKYVAGGTTDRDGYTEIEAPAGKYDVVLEGDGFETVTTKVVINEDGTVNMGTIDAIYKRPCDCGCHKNNFWAKLLRFFQEIVYLFRGKYTCCNDPSPLYKHV